MATVESIKKKYESERDKRFNVLSTEQGARVKFRSSTLFNDLDRDPWVNYDALTASPPLLRDGSEIRFLILGGGHSGILFAYYLIAAGFSASDIVIVDEAGGFGGTWYWNRYPGLTCDVEGYCYLPLLEETGFIPKQRYSSGEEIRQNVECIAEKFGIRGMFCTKAKSADWDDAEKRWVVKLQRDLGPKHQDLSGELVVRAQFIMPAGGVFYSPSAPDAPGLETFMKNRELFHTARWDYDYTGGSPSLPDMVNLQDKRVGIIGTGATAVGVVPELAKWAKHLYVFQRTPSYCGPREQAQTTPEAWEKVSNGPGWQYNRMRNFNRFLNDDPLVNADDDLVKDGWSRSRTFSGLIGSPRAKEVTPENVEQHLQRMLEKDAERASELRRYIEEEVEDPVVAEKLKPWYPIWCKRPTFHQDYLKTFNRPNVTLVDTDGQGISGYTEHGVLVGKGGSTKEYEVDVLVLATGFAATTGVDGDPSQVLGCPIRGRSGRELTAKWTSDEFATFFGVATHEFPNFFFWTAKGATGSANTTYPLTIAARTAAHIIKKAAEKTSNVDRLVLEVSREAELNYTEDIQKYSAWYAVVPFCTPSYMTDYKDPSKNQSTYRPKAGCATGTLEFERAVDNWAGGNLEGWKVRA
ncbi:cyclohexanone -monooxygenase [Colletotrichum incanum]|uniref:Cyclohexanone-monooxygenase n=1 Tax=Colletotrichum incanum TaxID=1573173 RepID=A0A166RZG0_COLIC|nr:cyclohexanone -monooxygenase [Colletotrichum incanum]